MQLRVYVKGTELEHKVKGYVSMRKSREEGRAAAVGPQGERATDWVGHVAQALSQASSSGLAKPERNRTKPK